MSNAAITAETVFAAHDCARRHGFWNGRPSMGEKLALVHSEVSEALEELRKPEISQEAFTEELADVVIRVMDISGRWDLDLVGAVLAKMKANEARPVMHGKRF